MEEKKKGGGGGGGKGRHEESVWFSYSPAHADPRIYFHFHNILSFLILLFIYIFLGVCVKTFFYIIRYLVFVSDEDAKPRDYLLY